MLTIVTPPAYIVSIDDAKGYLRLDHADEDTLLDRLISAAVAHLDGLDGFLGMALGTQKWRMTLDFFPKEILLSLPPVISVESVSYLDPGGADQVLPASAYQLVGAGERRGSRVIAAAGLTWPSTITRPESVAVEFICGHAEAPEPLRQAILTHVAHMWQHREIVPEANLSTMLPFGYYDLVNGYRSFVF